MRRAIWLQTLLFAAIAASGEACVTGEGFACEGAYSCPLGMACVGRICELPDGGEDSGNNDEADSGTGIPCGYNSNACPTGMICDLHGTCATPQYTEAGGVVTDGVTGLHWQQSASVDACPSDGAGVCNWQDAQTYCDSLNLKGTGWSLPTIQQLFSLVDVGQNPALDSTAFPDSGNDTYWSATEIDTGDYWSVFTYGGGGDNATLNPSDLANVMCVR